VARANRQGDQQAAVTGFRPPPQRHWRSYGTDLLPTPAEALGEPFSAFPSWFLRIECDRCGKSADGQQESRAKIHAGARPDATFFARMMRRATRCRQGPLKRLHGGY
jgi:hypothetical protein